MLSELKIYKMYYGEHGSDEYQFSSLYDMQDEIETKIRDECELVERVIFSSSPEKI